MSLKDFSLDEVKVFCKESKSFVQLGIKLGYKNGKGMIKSLRPYLVLNNIDYSHFKNFKKMEPIKTGIYIITNQCNHKVYIGQSINIKERWVKHKNSFKNQKCDTYDLPLYCAMRKYGVENFSFEILEECSKSELNDKEKFWIKQYDATNKDKGYNICSGGEGGGSGRPLFLNKEQVDEIKNLLRTTLLSCKEIGKKFGVGYSAVEYINLGRCWGEEGEIYPIRPRKPKEYGKYHCIDCGKFVRDSRSIRCPSCYKKYRLQQNVIFDKNNLNPTSFTSPTTNQTVTREELKNLIRTTSFLSIAKLYGVTDNTIRKWCKKFGLPFKSQEIKAISDKQWKKI